MSTLLRQILDSHYKVAFGRLPPRCVGLSETPNKIWIELWTRISPAKIYIHECLHLLHPEWSETEVLKMENKLWRKTTRHERYLLYRKLFSRRYRVAKTRYAP